MAMPSLILNILDELKFVSQHTLYGPKNTSARVISQGYNSSLAHVPTIPVEKYQ